MTRRLVGGLVVLVGVALALGEVLLHPTGTQRWELAAIVVSPAIVAAICAPLVGRWVAGRRTVAAVALTVGVSALTLGTVTAFVAANAMFLEGRDLRLYLILLVLSSGIALLVGSFLTGPLTRDLVTLGDVATRVAGGDLSVRSGIERTDEVGTTALAVDSMVAALAEAAEERRRLDDARRTLFSSIGHDLRTPLSALRAAVESLQDGIATDPGRTLAAMHAQVHAMDSMLDQLVEFTRLEAGHVTSVTEPISLAELVDDAAESLSPVRERRAIHLDTRYDGPATIDGSPLELSRLVRNLLDNAIRHSPDRGTVRVEIRTETESVELTVADDGPGFPQEFRDVAFEPFRRADPSRTARTGTAGLGLAICRAIADAHRGSIHLDDPPSGARIVVRLPRRHRMHLEETMQ
jgi:two-component system sensor histidine kinase BaeS